MHKKTPLQPKRDLFTHKTDVFTRNKRPIHAQKKPKTHNRDLKCDRPKTETKIEILFVDRSERDVFKRKKRPIHTQKKPKTHNRDLKCDRPMTKT